MHIRSWAPPTFRPTITSFQCQVFSGLSPFFTSLLLPCTIYTECKQNIKWGRRGNGLQYIILYANILCNVLSTILYDLYYSLYAPNMNKHWRRNREGGPDNLPSKLINIHTCSADRCDLSVYNVQPPPTQNGIASYAYDKP